MEITYENTLGDVIKFNIYHQSKLRVQQITLVIFIVILGIMFWQSAGPMDFSFVTKVGFVVICELFFLVLWAIASLLTIFFSNSSAKNKGVLTKHRVNLTETTLSEETNVNASSHSWSGITNVAQNQEYIIIYVSQHGAYIIPKRAFKSEVAAKEFFEYARQYWSKANAPALSEQTRS